jgi:Protein of unknown function (DUF2845)
VIVDTATVRRLALLAGAVCVGMVPVASDAQTLRCKNDLVSVGETKASVILKCGEPAFRDAFCQAPNTANANGLGTRPRPDLPCVNVEELTYKPGYGQRVTTLRFEENRLKSIAYGDRQ